MSERRLTGAQIMADADVRTERVIYIAGAVVADATPNDFREEFCDNLPESKDHDLYRQLPAMQQFADGDEWPDPANVAEALIGVPGFLVQAATPFRDQRGVSSWGHYYTAWLYAPSEADIARVCAEWAEARHAHDRESSP